MDLPGHEQLERLLAETSKAKLVESLARYIDPVMSGGYAELPGELRIFLAVWRLRTELDDGGLHRYYHSPSGDLAREAVTALETLGAGQSAQILIEANAIFGTTGPHADHFKRQHQLLTVANAREETLDRLDLALQEQPDDLAALLADFVRANRRHFERA